MFDFEKVVIWGYKINNKSNRPVYINKKRKEHTHSHIHQGFYKGFKKLGYETYWIDDRDVTANIDFKKSLFITMGDTENRKMPCRDDSFYIFHNSDIRPFFKRGVSRKKYMGLQVYTHDCIPRKLTRLFPDDPFQLYNIEHHILHFPWATDLFPDEIEENIKKMKNFPTKPVVNFVGMIIEPWDDFSKACKKNGIKFSRFGGFDKYKVSSKENMRLVQESIMAPAIVCKFQEDKGYIPCRIFKNISYGKYGITNSDTVNKLFFNELIYDSNVSKLFDQAYHKSKNINWSILEKHMRFVAERHTYLNRCQALLDIFKKIIVYEEDKL